MRILVALCSSAFAVLAQFEQGSIVGTFQTGLPFVVTMLQNTLNVGGGTQFPNRTGAGTLAWGEPTIRRWFDASAFAARPVPLRQRGAQHLVRARHQSVRSVSV